MTIFTSREKKVEGEVYRSWLGGIYATRQRKEAKGRHRLFWMLNW